MTDRVTAPHGAWPSPIAASDVARGGLLPSFPSVVGEEIWWQESRPDEGGRATVMHRAPDGTCTELLPPPWQAQTRVHEYGGRSYLPVPRRDDKAITRYGIVFANLADQRLYLLEKGVKEPQPLTPEPESPCALRYADMALSPDGRHILCVRERHTPHTTPNAGTDGADGAEPATDHPAGPAGAEDTSEPAGTGDTIHRSIVSVPLSGRAASVPEAITELVTGGDFYAAPSPSPDGTHLAWITWNHPRMPWEGSELRVGTFGDDGGLHGVYTLKGDITESVLAPHWRDNATICFVSDWPGWWNLYEIGLHGPAIPLYPAEEEFAVPPWQLGGLPYHVLDDGRIVAMYGHADLGVGVYDPATAELEPLKTSLTSWVALSGDGRSVVGIAGSPDTPLSVVRLDPTTGSLETIRRERDDTPSPDYLPAPRQETYTGRYGAAVHATVYPPTHPGASAEGQAPYVVWVHGGPTNVSGTRLQLEKAYFTSRGIGVVDVNYSGSAGYGRSYRDRLHRQWGVADVDDVTAVARSLVEAGLADPQRIAVRGSSAGGLTALLALTGGAFACGVSLFGVIDMLHLAERTHDFTSRYTDWLVGPLPGYEATYAERSPINRAHEIDVPVLLLQGAKDPAAPPERASAFAAALAERGIPHAHLEFADEAHGFCHPAARSRALEAELAFYGRVFGFDPPGVAGIELVTEHSSD